MASRSHVSLGKLLLFNLVISAAAGVMIWIFHRDPTHERILGSFLVSLVYSNVIGSLGYWLMPTIWPWARCRPAHIRYPATALALVGISVVGTMIGGLILATVSPVYRTHYWPMVAGSVRIAILLSFLFGGGAIVYETLRYQLEHTTLELRTKELERERALKLATEARLASLQSRVQPHFLFNALNSISSLIREDPGRAERLIEKMAAILRYSLDTTTGTVTLERELQIVHDYLEIESARFGPRLRYEVDVPRGLLRAEVPPFSLQTLVENSVKYAAGARRDGATIAITARGDGERVHLEVADDGPGFDPGWLK
ncbi:MAG TPA: histidine kinase, partial [Bryobacteraceae bacterium]|nr:histidine kinase [Bryobacteraceae bacterium]